MNLFWTSLAKMSELECDVCNESVGNDINFHAFCNCQRCQRDHYLCPQCYAKMCIVHQKCFNCRQGSTRVNLLCGDVVIQCTKLGNIMESNVLMYSCPICYEMLYCSCDCPSYHFRYCKNCKTLLNPRKCEECHQWRYFLTGWRDITCAHHAHDCGGKITKVANSDE